MAHMEFSLTVGMLLRRTVVRNFREAAFDAGLEFSYDEDKGWFDSHYIFKVTGSDDAVLRFKEYYVAALEEAANEHESDSAL